MQRLMLPRRRFLSGVGLAAASFAVAPAISKSRAADAGERVHLATNAYSWHVFYQREGRDFNAALETGLADVATSGLDGFEPTAGSPQDIERLAGLLKPKNLQMRSLYVNSTLHTQETADNSIDQILAIARAAKLVGTRIIVTNPNPIRWGGPESKDDAQLRTQAAALDRLGRELAGLGMTLAIHNHDVELKNAAREFHHMMIGTDPRYVSLCLDAHWIYRGAGNSQVALFDIVKLYGARVKELHLRQSQNGVWTETFGPGDIDYERLAAEMKKIGVRPHLVLEIAVENGTPKTLSPVEAHRQSAAYARRVFAGIGAE
ncbi:MAG TPA: TIM barrel protein [Verrucomicrobiota bacterium]|nr:TIM barrel protein [Verrucomicrobiota bacterium]